MYTILIALLIALSAVFYYYYINYHNIKGQYYAVKGNAEKALYHYGKAYDRKPKSVNTINYGYLLLRSGKLDEAEVILNSAFMLSKITEEDKKTVRMTLALVKWQKGDLDSAVSIYEKLLDEEENTTVYANLGFLYIKQGDIQKAYEFNKRAYEYNDTNNVILDNIAECCYLLGDKEGAYCYLKSAVESKMPIAENYFHFARILKERGETSEAKKYIEKASAMNINVLSGIKPEDIEKLKGELDNAK